MYIHHTSTTPDSKFWCRNLILRIWWRTQIFGVGTYFWQQRKTRETSSCVMLRFLRSAMTSLTTLAHALTNLPLLSEVCERMCSTLCQREDSTRNGFDRRPRRGCSPRRASRLGRLAALAARRRFTVARRSRPRKSSLLSRVKFVLRTNPLIRADRRKCPRGVPLEEMPPSGSRCPLR
jgi:hypothetical protein